MMIKNYIRYYNLSFILVIIVMLSLIPGSTLVEYLSLKPSYDGKLFLMEGWRILTGHFVHWSWPHLLTNVASLVILRFIFKPWPSNQLFLVLLAFSAHIY